MSNPKPDNHVSGVNGAGEQWSVARYGALLVFVTGDQSDDEQFSTPEDAEDAFYEAVADLQRADDYAGGDR